jgi:hypothetical protein
MDAWRYRDLDSGAFDRFWTSLIARGAALGEGLQLTFEQGIAPRGSRARFSVRDRRLEPRAIVEASAMAHCERESHTIRLWPAGSGGEFVGEVPAGQHGECTVEATIDERRVTGSIAIVDRPARGTAVDACEARASGARVRGRDREAGEEQKVARRDCRALSMSRVVSVHPMRAPWWLLPFAGCLSVEWWLRRRNGLR